MTISTAEIKGISDHLAETFNLNRAKVEDAIYDFISDVATEDADALKNKLIQRELDREQEDLTNSQM